jgi:hypothetical protein
LFGIVTAAAVFAATGAATGEAKQGWRASARQDVLAAYDLYVENHPGMGDPSNPGFPRQLERARGAALQAAHRAADSSGYEIALAVFSETLGDGHALIAPKDDGSSRGARLWPGFVAAWRGRMVVREAGRGFQAPAGSEVVSCDGEPIAHFVKQRLLTQWFRPKEAGAWWARAHLAFVSRADEKRPVSCLFKTRSGLRALTLQWSRGPADLDARLNRSSDGDRTPIGLSEPRRDLFLVGMPTFTPDEADSNAYQNLFETLAQRRADLLKARAVVIDLRHNNGGSSSWSRDTARMLWGRQAVDQRMQDYFRNTSTWWRASDGNISYVKEQVASFPEVSQALAAAKARGNSYFVERGERGPSRQAIGSDFTTPVYVITPGRCASACLDAVDTFKRFPNTKLIGAPTSADSTYMEVRVAQLPSGKGFAVIPMKFYSGRPRASGEVYQPDIELDHPDWSTARFLDRIETELGGGGSNCGRRSSTW